MNLLGTEVLPINYFSNVSLSRLKCDGTPLWLKEIKSHIQEGLLLHRLG